jgi:hypothetical protein
MKILIIDNFYENIDKSSFYLGMISQVYRGSAVVQVENLSWLSSRKIKNEFLKPNTINYYVVIDSIEGILFGEVYQSKISNSNSVHESLNSGELEGIYPEISIKIIGIMKYGNSIFEPSSFYNPGIMEKVYIANEKLVSIYFGSIEVNKKESKNDIKFATIENTDRALGLNINTIFNRHFMTIGTTNSGKSTSALSILDKLINKNKKVLIIDPTGEYENSFTENEEIKKLKLGENTFLPTSSVSIQQWTILFEANDSSQPAILNYAIKCLRYQYQYQYKVKKVFKMIGKKPEEVEESLKKLDKNSKEFHLELLSKQIIENSVKSRSNKYEQDDFILGANYWLIRKIENKLENTSILDFFVEKNEEKENVQKDLFEEIGEFISGEKSLYIDTSGLGRDDGIGAMIIDLITNYLLRNKNKNSNPFVLFIDEIHRYAKNNVIRDELGLTYIAREGRKEGIFLFLTTQNPKDVPQVLLGQIGTLLIHRLNHNEEIKIIENYLDKKDIEMLLNLNQGEAILTSTNLLKNLYLKIIKSNREHNNETPLL